MLDLFIYLFIHYYKNLAWLNIIAAVNEKKPGSGIKEILLEHYQTYGRNFFSRYITY